MDGSLRLVGLILVVTGVSVLVSGLARGARMAGVGGPSGDGLVVLGGSALALIGLGPRAMAA